MSASPTGTLEDDPYRITSMAALESLYGPVGERARRKETDRLTPAYRRWIGEARFVSVASAGRSGLDCSPRGDGRGELVHVLDERTIALPDRRGNNRLDTLRNLVEDPRIALMFLVPGAREALRINGDAGLTRDPALLGRFEHDGRLPVTVIRVEITSVYFQCARAIVRGELWPDTAPPAELPGVEEMLASADDVHGVIEATAEDPVTNPAATVRSRLY